MEKLIFLIIIIIISTVIDSFSKKNKRQDDDAGKEWDLEEFDFSKIAKKQQDAQQNAQRPAGGEPESYSDIKPDYIDPGVDTAREAAAKHAQGAPARPAEYSPAIARENVVTTAHHDPYAHSAPESADIIKTRGGPVEKCKTAVSADVDSERAIEALSAAAAAGTVVDLHRERVEAEHKESRAERSRYKKLRSAEKSSAAEVNTAAMTGSNTETGKIDIKAMFSGPELKKTILASIILDKPKF